MNIKRFIGAVVSVFITIQVLDFLIHGCILMKTYEALSSVWRPDMMSKVWIMHITSLIFSFLFVYIFTKGYENRGIGEGIRYGILISLLTNAVGMFNQYVVYPIPLSLVLKWVIFGAIEIIICGVVTALIYKPKSNA